METNVRVSLCNEKTDITLTLSVNWHQLRMLHSLIALAGLHKSDTFPGINLLLPATRILVSMDRHFPVVSSKDFSFDHVLMKLMDFFFKGREVEDGWYLVNRR